MRTPTALRPLTPAALAELRSAAAADHRSVIQLIQQLVQTPSRAGIDPYNPILEVLAGWLLDHGLTPRRLVSDTGDPVGLVCEVEGAHPGPRYVLDACVDTAPFGDEAAWSHPPTSAAVADGWLYGRGSSDCKAAAAIFAHLAARLRHQATQLNGSLTLLFDADEHTGGFRGAKRYFGSLPTAEVAGVMIGYPGTEHLVVGGRGFLRAAITIHGTAGHSGGRSPATGNAVEKAAKLIGALTDARLPAAGGNGFPLPPKLTVTAVHGGEPSGGYTIVPDRCVVHVDVRLTPTFAAAAAAGLLERTVATIDQETATTRATTVELAESWPAYRLPPGSQLSAALLATAEQVTGRAPQPKVAGPSNIGNYLAALGIEATAGFGVGYRNLHGTDECIDLATIPATQATYHGALLTLLTS